MRLSVASPSSIDLGRLLPSFVALDVLMMPFVGLSVLTFSMPIVILWVLRSFMSFGSQKDFIVAVLVLFLSLLSFIYALVFGEKNGSLDGQMVEVWRITLMNFGLFSLLILYFLYFRFNSRLNTGHLSSILLWYVILNLLLVTVYYSNHHLYFTIRTFWTLSSSPLEVGEFSSITRFTGIMSDPNNLAVAMVAVLAMILLNKSISLFLRYVLVLVVILIVAAGMSKSGLLALIVASLAYILYSISRKINVLQFLSAIIFIVFIMAFFVQYKNELDVVNFYLERIESSTLNDGRLNTLNYYLDPSNIIDHLILGQGGAVFIDGVIARPHLGFFYIMYNYGLMALIGFLYIIFLKPNAVGYIYYLPIYILFIGFFINSGLQDYRFLVLLALLSGVLRRSNLGRCQVSSATPSSLN